MGSELRELYFTQLQNANAEIIVLKEQIQQQQEEITRLKRRNAQLEQEYPSDGQFMLIPVECPDQAIQAGLTQVRETFDQCPEDKDLCSFSWADMVATWNDMVNVIGRSAIRSVDLELIRKIQDGELVVLPSVTPDPQFCDALFDDLRLRSFTGDGSDEPYIALADISGEKIYQMAVALKLTFPQSNTNLKNYT